MKQPKINRVPPAPGHLERQEKALWRSIAKEFAFDDSASVALLTAALEGHSEGEAMSRADRCRGRNDQRPFRAD
jgi:hypothetical protein